MKPLQKRIEQITVICVLVLAEKLWLSRFCGPEVSVNCTVLLFSFLYIFSIEPFVHSAVYLKLNSDFGIHLVRRFLKWLAVSPQQFALKSLVWGSISHLLPGSLLTIQFLKALCESTSRDETPC